MRTEYQVHRLDGYVDGKPSWVKEAGHWSRERMEERMEELQRNRPDAKFRLRQVKRK